MSLLDHFEAKKVAESMMITRRRAVAQDFRFWGPDTIARDIRVRTSPDQTTHYCYHHGSLALSSVLRQLFEDAGPFDLAMLQWTAYPEQLERLDRMLEATQIRDFRAIFDHHAVKGGHEFIEKYGARGAVVVGNTHAKLYLVRCRDTAKHFTINSSGHLNPYPDQVEHIVITESFEIWRQHRQWFDELFDAAKNSKRRLANINQVAWHERRRRAKEGAE